MLIPALGIPVSINNNIKIGHYLFAVGFLMEASTPLVCLRRILEILGKNNDRALEWVSNNEKILDAESMIKNYYYSLKDTNRQLCMR